MKKCTKCKKEKDFKEFYKDKYKKDLLHSSCKNCHKKNQDLKKDHKQEYDKKYYLKNKSKINKRKTDYCKTKRQLDKTYKFKKNIRRLISLSFKRKGNNFSKKTKTTYILGCTIDEFKSYIQSKFIENMTFENHGLKGWHLDHIIPISSAKTKEDIIRLNHYTNFQPLWAEDNLKKGNKIL